MKFKKDRCSFSLKIGEVDITLYWVDWMIINHEINLIPKIGFTPRFRRVYFDFLGIALHIRFKEC